MGLERLHSSERIFQAAHIEMTILDISQADMGDLGSAQTVLERQQEHGVFPWTILIARNLQNPKHLLTA